ncbi:hypothetical protein EVAR_89876_1 [Eumeta japonica]|uniref:Uncharacterized protein n=1 Tax=Eumeta variegata TaxID=151549 RepID=A0A4C1ZK90_EUMVA|nr:hypothetical protein EVAR_89876_1 [Eumeta japonica]
MLRKMRGARRRPELGTRLHGPRPRRPPHPAPPRWNISTVKFHLYRRAARAGDVNGASTIGSAPKENTFFITSSRMTPARAQTAGGARIQYCPTLPSSTPRSHCDAFVTNFTAAEFCTRPPNTRVKPRGARTARETIIIIVRKKRADRRSDERTAGAGRADVGDERGQQNVRPRRRHGRGPISDADSGLRKPPPLRAFLVDSYFASYNVALPLSMIIINNDVVY